MELKTWEQPQAVEQLLFEVKPEMVDAFIQMDHKIWTAALEQYPGFAGKETWVSQTNPGQVMSVIYWDSLEQWKAIEHQDIIDIDQRFHQEFGADHSSLIGELHNENLFYKVNEYR